MDSILAPPDSSKIQRMAAVSKLTISWFFILYSRYGLQSKSKESDYIGLHESYTNVLFQTVAPFFSGANAFFWQ